MGQEEEPVKVWAVILCVVQIFFYFILGVVLIFLYEFPRKELEVEEGEEVTQGPQVLRQETWQAWRGALRPGWLLCVRVFAFLYLVGLMIYEYMEIGDWLHFFNYYTECTLVLLILYFGWGTVVSIVEYRRNLHKHQGKSLDPENRDLQTGLLGEDGPQDGKAGFLGYTLQILFQRHSLEVRLQNGGGKMGHMLMFLEFNMVTVAPAVVLTDGVYWTFLYPLFPDDFPHTFSEFNVHALNAIFVGAELFLNSMRFPLFRAAYFFIYTSVYVSFEWYIHFAGVMDATWPYPFLEVSTTSSPVRYLGLGFCHILAYAIVFLLNRFKLLLQDSDGYITFRTRWGSLARSLWPGGQAMS